MSEPAFFVKPRNQFAVEGKDVKFKASIHGDPTPTVTWYIRDSIIEEGDKYKLYRNKDFHYLEIVDIAKQDGGLYVCSISNTTGVVSATAELEVFVKNVTPDLSSIKTANDGTNEEESLYTDTNTVEKESSSQLSGGPRIRPPKIINQLQNKSVCSGRRIELAVQIVGTEPIAVFWKHEDVKISPENKRYRMTRESYTSKLVLLDATVEDSGNWTVTARNAMGCDTSSCKITIYERLNQSTLYGHSTSAFTKAMAIFEGSEDVPKSSKGPRILSKSTNVRIEEGTCAQLVCDVQGIGPVNGQWSKDGKEITNGGRFRISSNRSNYSFQIPHSLATDSGQYAFTATNQYGKDMCHITLHVDEIESQEKIPDYRSLLKSRPSLRALDSPSPTHSSSSVCSEKENNSKRDILVVSGKTKNERIKPIVDQILPERTEVKEGDTITLSCVITGIPMPTISWFHGSKEIKESKYFKMGFDHDGYATLKIAEVYSEDDGLYRCYGRNILGVAETSGYVHVLDLSNGSSRPHENEEDASEYSIDNFSDTDNTDMTESCGSVSPKIDEATGLPMLKLEPPVDETSTEGQSTEDEFTKNNNDCEYLRDKIDPSLIDIVREGYRSGITKEEMTSAVSRRASLGVPTDEIAAALKRKVSGSALREEPPFIEDLSPENIHVIRGQSFRLSSEFVGDPMPQVKWQKGKEELVSDDRIEITTTETYSTLTVNDAQMSDTGCYVLTLTSELGTDKVGSSVTVEDRPDPPSGTCGICKSEAGDVVLSWYGPGFDGGTPITCYRIEIANTNDLDWKSLTDECKYTSYKVEDLEYDKEYVFRISAGNRHGFSEPGEVSQSVKISSQKDDMVYTDVDARVVNINSNRKFNDLYNLGQEIGKGRFGRVCSCSEKSSGVELAAKFIKMKSGQKKEIEQEINIMNELHHPKLLRLWDAFEAPRQIIIVTEFIAGGELFERIIVDDYTLTERECIHFMQQICDGVNYMHSKRILHLDLKPENILCISQKSTEIKIIDFGLAKKIEVGQTTQTMVGTPEFVAPEVINYDPISFTSDLWSVGVICYILLSGLSPFLGDNDTETLANVTCAQWDFEDEAFEEITNDAKDFIESLLVKNPCKRLDAEKCLKHKWLANDGKDIESKKLSTERHKKFMARRKWQKTATAIRALGRMASLQKIMIGNDRSSRSRNSSVSSISSTQSLPNPRMHSNQLEH